MKKLMIVATLMGAGALFAEDAYIASSATNAKGGYSISTGYLMKEDTCFVADFEFLARTADASPSDKYQQFVFETANAAGNVARIYINGSTGSGALAWNLTKENVWSTTSQTMTPGKRYKMTLDGYHRNAKLEIDGVQKYTGGVPAGDTILTATRPLRLFSNIGGGGNTAMMKLYRFTIYEKEVLVHDYVPALKGGIAGLYDEVTGEFIYDDHNTGRSFEYGGDILELEDDAYIENTGNGVMNTRFLMAPDTKVELDYALVSTLPLQARLFGADANTPFTAAYYINGSGNMSFGIGDEFKPWSTGCVTNYYRHSAVLDVAGDHAYYITRATTNWTGTASGLGASVTQTSTRPLAVFGNAANDQGTSFSAACKAKIYGFKCWKGGALVHDYVPCVKGGVPGFKDLVDNSFITAENPAALRSGGKGLTVEEDDGYISSSGNNNANGFRYINTGYTVTPHTRVEFDYALADNYPTSGYNGNHDWYMFEASGATRFNVYHNKDGMGWCGMGTNWRKYNGVVPPKQTTTKDVRRTLIVDNHTGFAGIITAGFTNYYDNVTAAADSLTYSTALKLASSSGNSAFSPIKIYGCRIYESGELVRNYVPYVKDGTAGLRDTETGGFITASGRVAFTAGGNIASNDRSDAYLESPARTLGINTGYLMKGSQSRVECDFAYTDTTTNSTGTTGYQQRAFGTDTAGNLKYALYINGSGNFMYGFGNTFINSHGPGTAADTRRYTAVIDGYHDRLYWIIGGVTNKTYDISGDAHGNTTDVPMGIFSTPNQAAATTWRNGSVMKLYSFRIYEQDVLVHEFVPYKKGSVIGLYDTVDKVVKTDARNSATQFKIGGKGVDGAEKWIVEPQSCVLRKGDAPVTLAANAVGAVSYKWTKNGAAVSGGSGGELTVEWVKGGATDTYAVIPVYDVFGIETDGEPVTCTVFNQPQGMTIVIQ